ncbi:MAG: thiosulfate oxidation carrier protein SoxY [Acetobacteraceae bacterium]
MGGPSDGCLAGEGRGRRDLLEAGMIGLAAFLAVPVIADAATSDVVAANAAEYPQNAFKETTEQKVLGGLYGKVAVSSDKITLEAPEIAENGAVVPVAVSTSLPDVTGVALLALNNPYTLACAYRMPAGTMPSISSRLKLKETTTVVAVIESDGKLYSTSKLVKVTLGGCG